MLTINLHIQHVEHLHLAQDGQQAGRRNRFSAPTTETCPHCKGAGEGYIGRGGVDQQEFRTCPRCGGSGRREARS
jgi:DnaJ-class molecular chaperone